MEAELKEIVASGRVPADLAITYDDMHGLWGGTTFALRGDGHLERRVRPLGASAPTISEAYIGERALLDLVRLLVDISAWEQRTPDSMPVPDESRAYLTLSTGTTRSVIWERYNGMQTNDRLIRVKNWLASRFGGPA
jgi:hypothetical protein